MATLFENYEQQYSVLTAEITSQIGRLNVPDAGNTRNNCCSLWFCSFIAFFIDIFWIDRRQLILEIDKHVEEAQELVSCLFTYFL